MPANGANREYELRPHRPLDREVRRVAREQIQLAIAEIRSRKLDRHEVVHEVRKRCKKIRALLRLVRPELDITYALENAWYRDTARALSFVRDAQALVETCEGLGAVPVDRSLGNLHRRVHAHCRARVVEIAGDRRLIQRRLRAAFGRLERGAERIAGWSLQQRDRAALRGGFARTYRRGRRAFERVFETRSDHAFHEWRKRVKYHWYHLRLLTGAWPEVLDAQVTEVKLLGQVLGDHHDLTVLRETILAEASRFRLSPTARKRYLALIGRRQRQLEAVAAERGARVFQERPRILTGRIEDYWYARQI